MIMVADLPGEFERERVCGSARGVVLRHDEVEEDIGADA
jgi:hypothetical protein